MIRPLCLPFLLWLALLPAEAIQISLTRPDAGSSLTELTISQPPGSLPEMVAREAAGAVLGNRIEVRFPSDFHFATGELEPGWSVQSAVVTEGFVQVGLATFYFCGLDPQKDLESYSFYVPWTASFSFTDSVGQPPAEEFPLRVEIFASAILPGNGQVPVSAESTLLAETSHSIPDSGGTSPLFVLGLGALAVVRVTSELRNLRHSIPANSPHDR